MSQRAVLEVTCDCCGAKTVDQSRGVGVYTRVVEAAGGCTYNHIPTLEKRQVEGWHRLKAAHYAEFLVWETDMRARVRDVCPDCWDRQSPIREAVLKYLPKLVKQAEKEHRADPRRGLCTRDRSIRYNLSRVEGSDVPFIAAHLYVEARD